MAEEANRRWIAATNWAAAVGSLNKTVSFETPLFPIEDDQSKTPLLLKSPPSISSPCEINVNFNQKHEVRQVYVRSTARIYEIYYATERQSSNEYLCTVRCGVATKEDDKAQMSVAGEATSEDLNRSTNNESSVVPTRTGKSQSNNGSSSEEDGWVEVKVPECPQVCYKNKSIAEEINQSIDTRSQDYYEATAEITDANPCSSLTLRFLSLLNKGCVSIEDLYVYAEPVETNDAGNGSNPAENTASRNLLAMLVPSLLHLSQSRASSAQDKHMSDTRTEQNLFASKSKASESVDPREVKAKESTESKDRPSESGSQFSHSESEKPPVNNLEKILYQLDSRVARIEAYCARFEESMLNPIQYMATRLERLEQKVDELTSRSQTTPTFFPLNVASEKFYKSISHVHGDNSIDKASNVENRDAPSDELSSAAAEADTVPAISPELTPHLIVTVPEFLTDDDDDDCEIDANCNNNNFEEVSELEEDASELRGEDVPFKKPVLSIDSALASALAALMSISTQSSELTPALMVKAPDFGNEDENGSCLGSSVTCDVAKNLNSELCGNATINNIEDSDSVPCTTRNGEVQQEVQVEYPQESRVELPLKMLDENWFKDDNKDANFGDTCDLDPANSEEGAIESRTDTEAASLNQLHTDTCNTGDTSSGENSRQDVERENDGCTDATGEGDTPQIGFASSDKICEDRLHNELKQTYQPVLDMKLPILEVKFVPQEYDCSLPLETLLGDAPESEMRRSDVNNDEVDNAATNGENFLDLGDNAEANHSVVNDPFSELDDLTMGSSSSCVAEENLRDPSVNGSLESISSLL